MKDKFIEWLFMRQINSLNNKYLNVKTVKENKENDKERGRK